MRAALAAAAACALFVAQAQAQTHDFTGTWAVQSAAHENFPPVSGTMSIRPADGGYAMQFTAHSLADQADQLPTTTYQTCRGQAQGARLRITCAVTSTNTGRDYTPDNFEVEIAGATMTGMLVSDIGNAPVVFSRAS